MPIEGTLKLQPSGRWAIARPGEAAWEISPGTIIRLEVGGELKQTRMDYSHDRPGGYYSIDGYTLRDGLRAAIGSE